MHKCIEYKLLLSITKGTKCFAVMVLIAMKHCWNITDLLCLITNSVLFEFFHHGTNWILLIRSGNLNYWQNSISMKGTTNSLIIQFLTTQNVKLLRVILIWTIGSIQSQKMKFHGIWLQNWESFSWKNAIMITVQMHFCTIFWVCIFRSVFMYLFDSLIWFSDDEISVENEWRVWSFLREHIQKRLLDKTSTIEVWTELKTLILLETICPNKLFVFHSRKMKNIWENRVQNFPTITNVPSNCELKRSGYWNPYSFILRKNLILFENVVNYPTW